MLLLQFTQSLEVMIVDALAGFAFDGALEVIDDEVHLDADIVEVKLVSDGEAALGALSINW